MCKLTFPIIVLHSHHSTWKQPLRYISLISFIAIQSASSPMAAIYVIRPSSLVVSFTFYKSQLLILLIKPELISSAYWLSYCHAKPKYIFIKSLGQWSLGFNITPAQKCLVGVVGPNQTWIQPFMSSKSAISPTWIHQPTQLNCCFTFGTWSVRLGFNKLCSGRNRGTFPEFQSTCCTKFTTRPVLAITTTFHGSSSWCNFSTAWTMYSNSACHISAALLSASLSGFKFNKRSRRQIKSNGAYTSMIVKHINVY